MINCSFDVETFIQNESECKKGFGRVHKKEKEGEGRGHNTTRSQK